VKEEPPKEKSDLLGKFSSLFKRGHAHLDFPVSERYEGPLESTHRQQDLHPHDIQTYSNVYHPGVYEHLEEKPVARLVVSEPKHVAEVVQGRVLNILKFMQI
jgi:hypothetical protein